MAQKTVASASQILQNWQSAMGNPMTAQKYVSGINKVTTSPMEQAAAPDAEQRYIQGVQQAVSSGKRAASLQAVTLAQWKAQATGVGASRLASGAQKGGPKYQAALQKWQGVYQAASNAAQALPKGGFAQAQARWAAATQVMMAAAGRT